MSEDRFVKEAQPLRIQLGEKAMLLVPRRFSTGSCGWFTNGASIVDDLHVQVTISVVVKHSKGWNGVDLLRKPGSPEQATTSPETAPTASPSPSEGEATPQALYRVPEAPEAPGDLPADPSPMKRRRKTAG